MLRKIDRERRRFTKDIERAFGGRSKHGDGGTRKILGVLRVKDVCKTFGGYNHDRVLGIRAVDYEKFFGCRGSGTVFGVRYGGIIVGLALAIVFAGVPLVPSIIFTVGTSLDAYSKGSKKKHNAMNKFKEYLTATNQLINAQEQSIVEQINHQSHEIVNEYLNSKEKVDNVCEVIINASVALLDNDYSNFIQYESQLKDDAIIIFKAHFHNFINRLILQDVKLDLSDDFIDWINRVESELYDSDLSVDSTKDDQAPKQSLRIT